MTADLSTFILAKFGSEREYRKHDDVIKWKHFPRYWPFVRGIHRSPVNSPHKGQWRGALMFSLICVWINHWVNNREAGDLRRYRAHNDVIVMMIPVQNCQNFAYDIFKCISWNVMKGYFAEICTEWSSSQSVSTDLGKYEPLPEPIALISEPKCLEEAAYQGDFNGASQWRHNESDGVSDQQPHDCLLKCLFRRRRKKNIKAPRHWPLRGEFTGVRWIPCTRGPYAQHVSIWWRHHWCSLSRRVK